MPEYSFDFANAIAIALPIPSLEPVIIATFFYYFEHSAFLLRYVDVIYKNA
jgi:hypothetical protein